MSSPATSVDPTRRGTWRAVRAPLAVAAVVLLAALVVVYVGRGGGAGALDPRATDREGSRALAQVLRGQGVRVDLVETTDAAVAAAVPGTTLLVVHPGRLAEAQLRRLAATPADLVLVEPRERTLRLLAPEITPAGTGGGSDETAPGCDLPAATRAGALALGGASYTAAAPPGGRVALCYASPDEAPGAPVVALSTAQRSVTVLGDPAPLSNELLDESGNAALALGLLGGRPRLTWYLPSATDVPAGGTTSPADLVPRGVPYGALMLLVAAVLVALWRGRRLGPVVAEPLPVVVRAAETAEGRARLYRRARARGRGAEALRAAAVSRLLPALGLPRSAPAAAVVDAAAGRAGVPREDVGALLYGAAPADDAALVRLASDLDRLEREVRRS